MSSVINTNVMSLNAQLGVEVDDVPTVLTPSPKRSYFGQATSEEGYFQFGEPNEEVLDAFNWMKEECDLFLDLLYGAPAWAILRRHWRDLSNEISTEGNTGNRELMYVHSGGLEGINSQLLRYKRRGLVAAEEIQMPGRNSGLDWSQQSSSDLS